MRVEWGKAGVLLILTPNLLSCSEADESAKQKECGKYKVCDCKCNAIID